MLSEDLTRLILDPRASMNRRARTSRMVKEVLQANPVARSRELQRGQAHLARPHIEGHRPRAVLGVSVATSWSYPLPESKLSLLLKPFRLGGGDASGDDCLQPDLRHPACCGCHRGRRPRPRGTRCGPCQFDW